MITNNKLEHFDKKLKIESSYKSDYIYELFSKNVLRILSINILVELSNRPSTFDDSSEQRHILCSINFHL